MIVCYGTLRSACSIVVAFLGLGLTQFQKSVMSMAKVKLMLSEHFSLDEFVFSATAKAMGLSNSPGSSELANLRFLCREVLEPARKVIGEPIHITSGYRCLALNQAVGGVAQSYHVRGLAADIHIESDAHASRLADALNAQPYCDLILVEHAQGASWLHVQARSLSPRHRVNLDFRL